MGTYCLLLDFTSSTSTRNNPAESSSGIQILPAIRPVVKRITTFVRGPTWVSPAQGLEGRKYSEEEKLKFAKESLSLLKYRKDIETSLNSQFAIFLSGSQTQIDTRNHMVSQMEGKLQIQYLKDRIIPKWSVGCRRLTPGINYLESLCADNVDTIYGEISEITSRGCVSEGKEYPVDVLICATGFDTSFKPRFPLIGPGGINLQVEWAKEPASYMGIAAPKFPNYLMFLGPNSPIGNGPVLTAIGKLMRPKLSQSRHQVDVSCRVSSRLHAQNGQSMANRGHLHLLSQGGSCCRFHCLQGQIHGEDRVA